MKKKLGIVVTRKSLLLSVRIIVNARELGNGYDTMPVIDASQNRIRNLDGVRLDPIQM